MLTYIQRGVGLMALLSMNLMGSENPYFQADGQPPVYLVTGTIHHRGLAWTHEGDTLTIKPLADQPPVPFQQLEIGYPTGTVVLGCGVEVVGKLNIAARMVRTNDTEPSPLLRVGQPDSGLVRTSPTRHPVWEVGMAQTHGRGRKVAEIIAKDITSQLRGNGSRYADWNAALEECQDSDKRGLPAGKISEIVLKIFSEVIVQEGNSQRTPSGSTTQ